MKDLRPEQRPKTSLMQIQCHRWRKTHKEHSDVASQMERNEYELPIPFSDSAPDSTNQPPCEKPELI